MKIYRLLRDNKETGPYTADELIQYGFKKYDLIWVDGKSAAWRYPFEVDVFKSFTEVMEEQPYDRFFQKPAPQNSTFEEKTTSDCSKVSLTNEIKKEKPRIKIKAECKRIDSPTDIRMQTVASSSPTSSQREKPAASSTNAYFVPGWKDILNDWEKEKVTERQELTKEKENIPVKTNFSQSLDDIKERYVETVLKNKSRKQFFTKDTIYAMVIIIFIGLLVSGMWIGFSEDKNNLIATDIAEKPANDVSRKNVQDNQQLNVEESSLNDGQDKQANLIALNLLASDRKDNLLKENKKVSATSSGKSLLAVSKNVVSAKENNPPVTQVSSHETPKVGSGNVINPLPLKENTSSLFHTTHNEPAINEFISINKISANETGATGVKYRVQNISDISVDLVMIDLQYYDNNGKLKKGETVYLRNIPAGQFVTFQAPDNASASKISYRISMVSSEEKNLYLIAE